MNWFRAVYPLLLLQVFDNAASFQILNPQTVGRMNGGGSSGASSSFGRASAASRSSSYYNTVGYSHHHRALYAGVVDDEDLLEDMVEKFAIPLEFKGAGGGGSEESNVNRNSGDGTNDDTGAIEASSEDESSNSNDQAAASTDTSVESTASAPDAAITTTTDAVPSSPSSASDAVTVDTTMNAVSDTPAPPPVKPSVVEESPTISKSTPAAVSASDSSNTAKEESTTTTTSSTGVPSPNPEKITSSENVPPFKSLFKMHPLQSTTPLPQSTLYNNDATKQPPATTIKTITATINGGLNTLPSMPSLNVADFGLIGGVVLGISVYYALAAYLKRVDETDEGYAGWDEFRQQENDAAKNGGYAGVNANVDGGKNTPKKSQILTKDQELEVQEVMGEVNDVVFAKLNKKRDAKKIVTKKKAAITDKEIEEELLLFEQVNREFEDKNAAFNKEASRNKVEETKDQIQPEQEIQDYIADPNAFDNPSFYESPPPSSLDALSNPAAPIASNDASQQSGFLDNINSFSGPQIATMQQQTPPQATKEETDSIQTMEEAQVVSALNERLRRMETDTSKMYSIASTPDESSADANDSMNKQTYPFDTVAAISATNPSASSQTQVRNIEEFCEAGKVNVECSSSISNYLDSLAAQRVEEGAQVVAKSTIASYLDSISSNDAVGSGSSNGNGNNDAEPSRTGAAFSTYLDALSSGSVSSPPSAKAVAGYLDVLTTTASVSSPSAAMSASPYELGSRIADVEQRLSRLENSVANLPDDIASRLMKWQMQQDQKLNDEMSKIMEYLMDAKSMDQGSGSE